MHIVLIHQAFAALGEPGGTRHHEMARHLAQMGHRVTVLTDQVNYLTGERSAYGLSQPETDDTGVRILRVWAYPAWHRSFAHRLLSFFSFMALSTLAGLMIREVDLVWGTSPPLFQGLSAWLLSRIKGAPFLMEVRDLWPYFAIETGVIRRPTLIRLSEALERFLYRHADALVVNSPGYVEHVQARGGERVQVIPNGVDTGMFMPTEGGDEFRRRHNLQGKFIAMYAGAHGLSNDLHVLLEAAGQLREHDHIAIVLVGDGKEKSALRASAEARGLTNVRFLSPLPKEEMPAALAAADLCIAILKPIRAYATTYPNKVFDYMAAARPVLLAIDGVIRELVESAGAGIYVPPGDPQAMAHAIITLEAAPGDRDRMGMQGRSYVESHFQRSALTLQLAALMQSLLRAGKDDPFAGGAP